MGLRVVMTKPIENSDNQEWISIFPMKPVNKRMKSAKKRPSA
jgi:hypothetical protein